MKYFVLIVVLLNTAILPQAKDVKGWNRSYWGMTSADLDSTFKNEIIIKERESYAKSYSNREFKNLEISSQKYKVIFLMDNKTDKLTQVNVKPLEQDGPFKTNFENLSQILTDKYGQPTYNNDNPGIVAGMVEYRKTWSFKSTVVELIYSEIKSIGVRILTLVYKQRVATDSEKI